MTYTPFARVDITCKGITTAVFVHPHDIPVIKNLLTGVTRSFTVSQLNGPDMIFRYTDTTAVHVW